MTTPATTPVLEARQLWKHYVLEGNTIPVLKGVDLTVRHGEWVALVGRSGCGKTTLLHLLGNLDNPCSGMVLLDGRPYAKMGMLERAAARRRRLGFVFQAYHLFPELNALENVLLPARGWFGDGDAARKRATSLLEGFGLGHRLHHRPQELSGGEQQRVAIARALVNDPGIILADEPTGNLDGQAGAEILAILQKLHKEDGRTIIMVTHDLKVAALADRICRLDNGVNAAMPAGK